MFFFFTFVRPLFFFFFFFNDTATTEIYTLSLHDALPIWYERCLRSPYRYRYGQIGHIDISDRKSTRLNSSHVRISYAVFCLKKKKKKTITIYIINLFDLGDDDVQYYRRLVYEAR